MECIVHCRENTSSSLTSFTAVSWDKAQRCAREWQELDGAAYDVALRHQAIWNKSFDEVQEQQGYHRECYSFFTNIINIERAKRRIERAQAAAAADTPAPSASTTSDDSEVTPSARRRRRDPAASRPPPGKSSDILPAVCIICKKESHYVQRNRKRAREKLSLAETKDAGMLRRAAELKGDEVILLDIRDRDCVAIEVRYHRDCYLKYTRDVYRENSNVADKSQPSENVPQSSFDVFCETIVEDRVLRGQEILRLQQLRELYRKCSKTHDKGSPVKCRTHRLKEKLQARYPQLCFHRPKRRTDSEIVYANSVDVGPLVEAAANKEDQEENESDDSTDDELPTDAVDR